MHTDFCLSSDGTKLWYTNDDHIFSVKISDWSEFIEIKEDENFSWHTFNFTKDNQYLIYSKQTNDKNLVSEIYSLNTGEIIKTANQAKGEFVKKCFFETLLPTFCTHYLIEILRLQKLKHKVPELQMLKVS